MAESWNILVVDDEPDIHSITSLSLKTKSWQGKKFNFESAYSAKEAQEVLAKHEPGFFHVALVDVVMETDDAGLTFCEHVRKECPRTLRLILRTGQPGVAPEEQVLNDYDIDQYLAKPEATPEKLFAMIRASLRASQDIALIQALKVQLEGFTGALHKVSTLEDLMTIMDAGLKFVEFKHDATVVLLSQVEADQDKDKSSKSARVQWTVRDDAPYNQAWSALAKAKTNNSGVEKLLSGSDLGLEENQFVMLVPVLESSKTKGRHVHVRTKGLFQKWKTSLGNMLLAGDLGGQGQDVVSGLFVQFKQSKRSKKDDQEFLTDLKFFLHNWKASFGAFCLQDDVSERRVRSMLASADGASDMPRQSL